MKKFILSILLLLPVGTLQGASPAGMSFLKINPSPKAYALGGSNAIASLGAESSNPAQIGISEKKYELFSSYSSLMDGAQFGHVSFALNRNTTSRRRVEAIGFSLTRLSVSDLDGRDSTGAKTG